MRRLQQRNWNWSMSLQALCLVPVVSLVHGVLQTSRNDTEIIYLIPSPELHVMLGAVNSLCNHLLKEFEKMLSRIVYAVCDAWNA